MAKQIIDARVRQKVGTEAEWLANDLTLLDGEAAIVRRGDGMPVNLKFGDGNKKFSELPYFIQYDQAAYISYTASPAQDVAYTIVGEGTYGSITVASGKLAVLGWNGSAWSENVLIDLPSAPPVTKPVIQEFAYTKDEYVNQVLVDTVIAPTITVNSVNITDELEKDEWLKKLDQCFKSLKVFGIPEGKFLLIRQFTFNPSGNLGIGFVIADNEYDDVNVNANNNGFVAVAKDYSKPFTIEFRERYREHTYLVTLDLSPLGGNNVAFNFRDASGIANYKSCGIKYTSISNIPKKSIWGTGFNYTNGSTEILPQGYYFHEAIKYISFKTDSNELLRVSGFSYDATNSNIIVVAYSCLDDTPSNLDVVAGRSGYSIHRFTIPVSDRGLKRYESTRPSGTSSIKGNLIIDLDYLHSKLPSIITNGLNVTAPNNRAQWILTPGGGGSGIVTSLMIIGGGGSFQGNFSFNPTANWAVNASGNMSKLTRIPEGTTSLEFNLSLNGVGYNILFLDKDFQNLGWGYDGSSGIINNLTLTPPLGAVFFLVCTNTSVSTASVTAIGSFDVTPQVKTYRSLAEGLGDYNSGSIFIVKDKYFRKLVDGVCSLSEYTPIDGGWLDSVPVLEKDGAKVIPTSVPYSGIGNGTFTGGVMCAIDKGSMYFYNNSAKSVYKSLDNGNTFIPITDKFSHPDVWNDITSAAAITDQRNTIVVLENGDLLIPIRVTGAKFATTNGVDRYERYWCLFRYSLSNGSMTKCFEFSHESYVQDWDSGASNYGWAYYSSGCMLGDFTHWVNGNTIIITEYGEGTSRYWFQQGISNNARGISGRAWISMDNGITWKKMFDGDRKKTGTAEDNDNWYYFTSTYAAKMRHMHGLSIDNIGGRVYLTNGDNEDYLWNISLEDLQSWYTTANSVDPNEAPSYKEIDVYPNWDSPLIVPSSGNSNYAYSLMRYQMMQNISVNNGVQLELHDASRSFAYVSYVDSLGDLVVEPVHQFERREDFASETAFVASWGVTDSFVQHGIKHNGVIYATFNNAGAMPTRIEATIDGYKWKTVFVGDNSDIKFAGKILFNGSQVYLCDGTFGQASNTSGYFKLKQVGV